ncbi:hypothetical protein SAMN05878482_110101 [Peribacillus simplex]|uniref:Uncharacterized protein n=1 Tax=Peribacillus simplex TaxID=1478 RepID=A0A9X8WN05_9BACI|nr:hypothetical protein SAMN05878482_110101 [Peribacillus simplex]
MKSWQIGLGIPPVDQRHNFEETTSRRIKSYWNHDPTNSQIFVTKKGSFKVNISMS